jgi:hypothetical protein
VGTVGKLDGVNPKAYHGIIHFLAAASIIIGRLITRKIISIVQRIRGKEMLGNAISNGFHAYVFGEPFKAPEGELRSAGSAEERHSAQRQKKTSVHKLLCSGSII